MRAFHSGRAVLVAGAFLVASGGAIAGCAAPLDSAAISTYATTTAQSATAFAAVARDFGASCERRARALQGIVVPDTIPVQVPVLIAEAPPQDAFQIQAPSAAGYTLPPAARDAGTPTETKEPAGTNVPNVPNVPNCADASDVSTGWDEANGVILNYVQALGNLANVDAAPSPNPAPLVAGLAKAGVTSAATKALSDLVVKIASFFQGQARDREIRTFLEAVNPHVPNAIAALQVVDASYTIQLEAEYSKTRAQYATYVRNEVFRRDALAKKGDFTGSEAINRRLALTRAGVGAALDSINQHLRASRDYGNAMAGILKTHQELYRKSQSKASFRDLLNVIKTTGQPVLSDLQDLMKAVK